MFLVISWVLAAVLLVLKLMGLIALSGWWIVAAVVFPVLVGIIMMLTAAFMVKKMNGAFYNNIQGSGDIPLKLNDKQIQMLNAARAKLIK